MRHKFTDKEWDAETGLYYFGARYYDPKLARFISADPIVPMPFYPQTLNRYSYAYNNPIVVRDLNGNCGILGAIVSFVGSILQGAVNIVVTVVGAVATGAMAAVGLAGRGLAAVGRGAATVAKITGGAIATAFRGGGKGGKGPDISGGGDPKEGDTSKEPQLLAMTSLQGALKYLKSRKLAKDAEKAYKASKALDTAKDIKDRVDESKKDTSDSRLSGEDVKRSINMIVDSPNPVPFVEPLKLDGGYLDQAIDGYDNNMKQIELIDRQTNDIFEKKK